MRAGDQVELEITHVLPAGEGEGALGDRKVRVPGLFPGERATVRLDHLGKNATFASKLELLEEHPARRIPPCRQQVDAYGWCTGCALMPLEEPAQRALLKEMLTQHHGLEVDEVIAAPKQLGYRQSAKRIAYGTPGKLRLGSYLRGSHRPADMRGCLVDHPRITEAADELAELAREHGLCAHDERFERLGLRAVWLRTNGEQVLTTLVTSENDEDAMRAFAERLMRSDGVSFCLLEGDGNALRGAHATHLCGIEELDVAGTKIGPLGFLQPNPEVAARMYDDLVAGVNTLRVFDLYAGSGATTRRLRDQGCDVTPCESHPESADKLGVESEKAEDFLARQEHAPDLVLANPPRKGLGQKVTAELLRLAPQEIRIMACGPAGLAKDLAALAEGYTLETLRAYDTLPQTPHVELIAKLVRR